MHRRFGRRPDKEPIRRRGAPLLAGRGCVRRAHVAGAVGFDDQPPDAGRGQG